MNSAGQRAEKRLGDLRFYVDSLTPSEQSVLAARYLRKIPDRHRRHLLRTASIKEMAFAEVFSKDTYGW